MELADLSIKFGRRKLGYHRFSLAYFGKGDRFGYGDLLRHSLVNLV